METEENQTNQAGGSVATELPSTPLTTAALLPVVTAEAPQLGKVADNTQPDVVMSTPDTANVAPVDALEGKTEGVAKPKAGTKRQVKPSVLAPVDAAKTADNAVPMLPPEQPPSQSESLANPTQDLADVVVLEITSLSHIQRTEPITKTLLLAGQVQTLSIARSSLKSVLKNLAQFNQLSGYPAYTWVEVSP